MKQIPSNTGVMRVQRVFWPQYNSEEKLTRLLEWVKNYPGLCDGVSLFTEGDGCDWRWYGPEEVNRRAAWVTQAVRRIHEAGLSAHVNILNTLGHSDDGGPDAPRPPFRTIVALDGTRASVCGCPSDPRLWEDIENKYAAFSRSGADLYWIDDDLRLSGHYPVLWGCFCESCLAEFSKACGTVWRREALAEALCHDEAVRGAWRSWSGRILHKIFQCCVAGIRKHAPDTDIGLMTGDIINLQDADVNFGTWLEGTGGRNGWWLRPGPGFWKDDQPQELLEKLHGVANTLDQIRGPHRRTLYEVENYPFTPGSKSAAQTGTEVLLALLTTGCEGAMFDLLDMSGNPPDWSACWWDRLRAWAEYWDQAPALANDMTPLGWLPVFSPEHFIHRPRVPSGDEKRHPKAYKSVASALMAASLPVTANRDGALGYVLGGEMAEGMSCEELERLADKPLIMDGHAASVLLRQGLGPRFGLQAATPHTAGVYEHFTDHPLNGPFGHANRAMTLAYTRATSWIIEPVSGQAEILSHLLDYHGNALGPTCLLISREGNAPRLVLGHLPWAWHLAAARLHQLRTLSYAMLADENLPVVQEGDAVRLWLIGNPQRDVYRQVLYNASFDEAQVTLSGPDLVQLRLRTHEAVSLDLKKAGLCLSLPAWSVAVIEWREP